MWRETHKPLPVGTHVASAACAVPSEALHFIADISAADAYGRPVVSQGIFDAVLAVVGGARRFIVLDYTAFGTGARGPPPVRRLAEELTAALLARRREQPELAILFITDPVNEAYGAARSPELQLLRAAGIEVVITDLDRLRDSNFPYSSLWRLGLKWWDGPTGPLGVTARRLNFKADGRKLVIADDGNGGLTAVIGSLSPQDRQSGWSNLAARVSGGPLQALLASELAVARFSGWRGSTAGFPLPAASAAAACATVAGAATSETSPETGARAQLLTEGAIRAELLGQLDAAAASDSIDVAASQLADRGVIASLLAASRRGVTVRLILDPNETGSSGGTAGLPNQPVASELVSRSGGTIRVRWYRTHGERFHGALVVLYGRQRMWLALGSAQLTRRSLDDYDLAANIAIELPGDAPLARQVSQYFETLWSNRAAFGIEYTADFATFADPSQADYWLYRLLEGSGFAPF
jgi:phosphatidylserine/phosphatidylglycerophosphate/cardiolipin synthase-like enzyme